MKAHIIGYRWAEYGPILPPDLALSLTVEGEFQKYPLPLGSNINLEFTEQRSCIGFYDPISPHDWKPCPVRRQNIKKCKRCVYEGGFPCFQEHLCSNDKPRCGNFKVYENFCLRPYHVYLVLIGNLSKIGITHFYRVKTRFIEQGADSASIILLEENRMDAAKVEHEILTRFKAFGLREHVPETWWSKNLVPFIRGPNKVDIDNFEKLTEDIRDWLVRKKYKVPRIEKFTQNDFYYPNETVNFEKVRYASSPVNIKGRIVFLKGPIVVCRLNADLIAYNLNDLMGRFFEVDEYE